MKKSILTVIAGVAALLVISGIGYSYDVVDVQVSTYVDYDVSEFGYYSYSTSKKASTYAYADMYGIYGEDPQYAYISVNEMRSVTIVDYDPQSDPDLTARMFVYTDLDAWAQTYDEDDYWWLSASGTTYINGFYSYLSIQIEPPYESDFSDTYFVEYEDVSYNNATIDYGHAAHSCVYLDTSLYLEANVYGYARVTTTIEED